jgi:hypothetical protein
MAPIPARRYGCPVAVESERVPQTAQRRLTQMELALDANLSTKHLSFVETGRSRPSRQLLVHLTCRSPSVTAGFSPAASLRPT